MILLRICESCQVPVNARENAEHETRGHKTTAITLHLRTRGGARGQESQWSSQWAVR